jgi:N-ethylmaleimide reductase
MFALQIASKDTLSFNYKKEKTMKHAYQHLLRPVLLGSLQLKNAIVMAPMTRARAIGTVPNNLMVQYYSARADAGLLIAESTAPSPNGLGYSRIPGIFSDEQVNGWKAVTAAVHAKGGKIFLQLMHTGRISHPVNMPQGARILAPSPIAAAGQMWTDVKGMQDFPVPEGMTSADIAATIKEYADGARKAIAAGFDGVEIHAANGYLPNQFLNAHSNQREDAYGGSAENRNRFVLELATAVAEAIGAGKTGIRIFPFGRLNDLTEYEGEDLQFIALAQGLGKLNLAYLHVVSYLTPDQTLEAIKTGFGGPIMLNGGYTAERAESDLASGKAALISFGKPFIANPDFVAKVVTGTALLEPDPSTFYAPGPEGYIDYPETVRLN